MSEFPDLQREIATFAREREWDQFHTAKNLAMALGGEVGELLAELQWVPDDSNDPGFLEAELRERVVTEVADIAIYLFRFADVTGIDLATAVRSKLEQNSQRYPADLARGSSEKYTRLQPENPA